MNWKGLELDPSKVKDNTVSIEAWKSHSAQVDLWERLEVPTKREALVGLLW